MRRLQWRRSHHPRAAGSATCRSSSRDRDRFRRGQGAGLAVGLRRLHRAFDPLHTRQVDALLLQQPADLRRGRHGVELHADIFAG